MDVVKSTRYHGGAVMRMRSMQRGLLAAVAAAVATGLGSGAAAQRAAVEALTYPVTAFVVEYALDHPTHPSIAQLEALPVELRVGSAGLLPPHPTTPNLTFPLGRVPAGQRFYTGGLRHVSNAILAEFQARGIDGVLVTFPQIEADTGNDLRPVGETRLLVRIWTGRVESVSTVADGDRFGGHDLAARTNRPEHAFLREGSPVRPGGPDGLLRASEIEDHAFRLSRHPGRRVDALLRPGELPGATRVEYHVAESKPWLVWAGISNTGTDATTDWRERFGLSHNQVTGHDDVLSVDYVTGNFDEVHGVFGSYEAPIFRLSGLRALATGSYSRYDASEVGVARSDAEGDQWHAGGRLVYELFQHRELFVDAFAGASWRNVTLEQGDLFGDFPDGDGDFFLPEAGLRVRRHTGISSAALDAWVDRNLPSVAGNSDEAERDYLGRDDTDESFTRVHWQGALSLYLEPALRWRRFADPDRQATSMLAHELLVSTQGQVSLGDRLIPQFQQIAGGLYTVRGYEQSIVGGDTVLIGSAEYRLHLARLLLPDEAAPPELPVLGKIQIRPQHVYDLPDWDFIVKAFVDAAQVTDEDAKAYEDDQTLLAIGLGAELRFLKNLSARVDVGWPQQKLEGEDTDGPEIHGALTVLY
jgi:hemolysin activation/secretion protein